jgi:hypothetical protein
LEKRMAEGLLSAADISLRMRAPFMDVTRAHKDGGKRPRGAEQSGEGAEK